MTSPCSCVISLILSQHQPLETAGTPNCIVNLSAPPGLSFELLLYQYHAHMQATYQTRALISLPSQLPFSV